MGGGASKHSYAPAPSSKSALAELDSNPIGPGPEHADVPVASPTRQGSSGGSVNAVSHAEFERLRKDYDALAEENKRLEIQLKLAEAAAPAPIAATTSSEGLVRSDSQKSNGEISPSSVWRTSDESNIVSAAAGGSTGTDTEFELSQSKLMNALAVAREMSARAAALQEQVDRMSDERRENYVHKDQAERERERATRIQKRELDHAQTVALHELQTKLDQQRLEALEAAQKEYTEFREKVEARWEAEKKAVYSVVKSQRNHAELLKAIKKAEDDLKRRPEQPPPKEVPLKEAKVAVEANAARVIPELQPEEEEKDQEHEGHDCTQETFESLRLEGKQTTLLHLTVGKGDMLQKMQGTSEDQQRAQECARGWAKEVVHSFGFWDKERSLRWAGDLKRNPQKFLGENTKAKILSGRFFETLDIVVKEATHVFSSATFWDGEVEREALRAAALPFLTELSELLGLQFHNLNFRWGSQEWTFDDHTPLDLAMEEIRLSEQQSLGPAFVGFITNKYGYRPLPRCIPAKEFTKLLNHCQKKMTENSSLLLESWYILDTNTVPPQYVLQRVGEKIPGFCQDDPEEFRMAALDWARHFEHLQGMLRMAAERITASGGLEIEDARKYSASIMDAEIRDGGLANPNRNQQTFIFRRKFTGVTDHCAEDEDIDEYFDMEGRTEEGVFDQDAQNMLNKLNTEVGSRLKENRVFDFMVPWKPGGINPDQHEEHQWYIDGLCSTYLVSLTKGILENYEKHVPLLSPEIKEILRHHSIARQYCSTFMGREADLRSLAMYVIDSDFRSPQMVIGKPTIGKSALLAQAAAASCEDKKSAVSIVRFCKRTRRSSSLEELLRSVCSQIVDSYHLKLDVPATARMDVLGKLFRQSMALSASSEKPLVIWLDSVDSVMVDNEGIIDVSWLPKILPDYAKIILSASRADCISKLQTVVTDPERCMDLKIASILDVEQMMDKFLTTQSRQMTPGQAELITEGFQECDDIRFVDVALRLSLSWHSYTVPEAIGNSFDELVEHIVSIAREMHGDSLVIHSLGYLVCSARGLTIPELEDVLSLDDEVLDEVFKRVVASWRRMPPLPLRRMLVALRPLLVQQTEGKMLLQWTQEDLPSVLTKKYFKDPELRRERHCVLAQYFSGSVAGRELPFPTVEDDIQDEPEWVEISLSKANRGIVEQQAIISGPVGARDSILNERREAELVHHLEIANLTKEFQLEQLSPEFLEMMASRGKFEDLSAIYSSLSQSEVLESKERELASELRLFVHQQDGVLRQNPRLLLQQLMNHAPGPQTEVFVGQYYQKCIDHNRAVGPFLKCNTVLRHRDMCRTHLSVIDHTGNHERQKITILRFSNDDKTMAIVTEQRNVAVWDLEDKKLVHILNNKHEKEITAATFSNSCTQFATGCVDGSIRIFTTSDWSWQRQLNGHVDKITELTFAPDDLRLYSGSAHGLMSLAVWDVQKAATIYTHGGDEVRQIRAFEDNSARILHGNNKVSHLVVVSKGSGTMTELAQIKSHTLAMCLHPKQQKVLHCSMESVYQRELEAGSQQQDSQLLSSCQQKSPYGLTHLIMSMDGSVVLRSSTGSIEIFDSTSGDRIGGIVEPLCGVIACSPNAKFFATLNASCETVHVWDRDRIVSCGGDMVHMGGVPVDMHSNAVTCVQFSPQSHLVASGSMDTCVRIWNVAEGVCKGVLSGHAAAVVCLDWAWDGSILVSGADDGSIIVWDISGMKKHSSFDGLNSRPYCVKLSHCGLYVAAGTSKKTVHVWKRETREQLYEIQEPHDAPVAVVGFDPETTSFFTVSNGKLRIFCLEDGDLLVEQPRILHYRELTAASLKVEWVYLEQGAVLATANGKEDYSSEGLVKTWQLHSSGSSGDVSFESMTVSPHGWWVTVDPKGKLVVGQSKRQRSLSLCDASSGSELHLLSGHEGTVLCASFSQDGALLASGSGDRTVRIWNTATGELFQKISGHEGGVTTVAIAVTGIHLKCRVAAGSWWDMTVSIWECPPEFSAVAQQAEATLSPKAVTPSGAKSPQSTGDAKSTQDRLTEGHVLPEERKPRLISVLADRKAMEDAGIVSPFGEARRVLKSLSHPEGIMICASDTGYRLFHIPDSIYLTKQFAVSDDAMCVAIGNDVGAVRIYAARGLPTHDHCIDRSHEFA